MCSCHQTPATQPTIHRAWLEKEISFEECRKWCVAFPQHIAGPDGRQPKGTTSKLEIAFDDFRKSIQPTDRIWEWFDPISRRFGIVIMRDGRLVNSFTLFTIPPQGIANDIVS